MSTPSLAERLFARVEKTATCWLWTGPLDRGYGSIKIGGRNGQMVGVHRVAYQLLVGPIPVGLHVDHLCRVRNCVNPGHLEAVLPGVNTLRSMAPAAENARLTVCKKAGHPLTPENVSNDTPGHRRCKICRSEYEKARHRRRYVPVAERSQERAA